MGVSSLPDWTPDVAKPKHIAIIMDGNQRWARAQGLPSLEGHRAGARAVRRTLKACAHQGIQVLTLFAFSSENWRRPEEEVAGLMSLFLESLEQELPELIEQSVRLRFFGDLSAFSKTLRQQMHQAMAATESKQRIQLNVGVNYGGRWDIVQASQALVSEALEGQIQLSDVDEQRMDRLMCLADCPPVDLCIRTSGEERISNFLLWQLAYAELSFTPVYWPDFDGEQLQAQLEIYSRRKRRFGRSQQQINQTQLEQG